MASKPALQVYRQCGRLSHGIGRRRYHTPGTQALPAHPPMQSAILQAASAHIPLHGFSNKAISLGATDAGYPPVSTNLFPRGAFDLVQYHLITARQALANDTAAQPLRAQASSPAGSLALVHEALNTLIIARLRANAPIQRHLTGMLGLMSLAGNIPASLKELGLLADELVYLSGDVRVDGSWYAHRAGVAGVYAASELFMAQDKSPGFVETERFVERRLYGIARAGYVAGSVGEWLGGSAIGAVNVARSFGVRI